jgi:deoxyribodipyrimidine photolyase-related protein
MSEISLIYPHQLYFENPVLKKDRKILLLEDPIFFNDCKRNLRFHKQKLVLHRASMRCYFENKLAAYDSEYIEYQTIKEENNYLSFLKKCNCKKIHLVDPTDSRLEKKLEGIAEKLHVEIHLHQSPNFLTSKSEIKKYYSGKKRFFHHYFYQWQRKRLNILVDSKGKPNHGKWSFDAENREKIPSSLQIPQPTQMGENKYCLEAKNYIQEQFADNPGSLEHFNYPISHQQAEKWWEVFLNQRLKNFGTYEDAILKNEKLLFHSLISPLLNIGLLDPKKLLTDVLAKSEEEQIPFNSLEGFIRQLIGWREYMRAVYLLIGDEQRNSNSFNHHQKLTADWYSGNTGIAPVDHCINKLKKYSYCHHIERLMILGNIMLLSEIDPKNVYQWFMELFIDAYDWVMVPNIYGMSQYADGGRIVTKPYISGSRYILKMSDFKKDEWSKIWDGLFWNFIDNHKNRLKKEARMGLLVSNWQRQNKEKKKKHKQIAEKFIKEKTKN